MTSINNNLQTENASASGFAHIANEITINNSYAVFQLSGDLLQINISYKVNQLDIQNAYVVSPKPYYALGFNVVTTNVVRFYAQMPTEGENIDMMTNLQPNIKFFNQTVSALQQTYFGFDFTRIWSIQNSYPVLMLKTECNGSSGCSNGICQQSVNQYYCQCNKNYIFDKTQNKCIPSSCSKYNDVYCQGQQCMILNGQAFCECALTNNCNPGGCPFCQGNCSISQSVVNCTSCAAGYTGDKCDICASLSCNTDFTPCTTCNGDCVIDKKGQISCTSCTNNFDGISCTQCKEGYTMLQDECVIINRAANRALVGIFATVTVTVIVISIGTIIWLKNLQKLTFAKATKTKKELPQLKMNPIEKGGDLRPLTNLKVVKKIPRINGDGDIGI
ncbi:High_cysteine membrane protein Group 2 [Hexamita inflata]|uniref:High cysteine membrane protein Group 2 n=1 Tax=Hexamita inflata TaxID=28002 RepID=A0AA86TUW7_9EUKA|nr:High cysteine membrane protein Group 2 [Hexamita inflata]